MLEINLGEINSKLDLAESYKSINQIKATIHNVKSLTGSVGDGEKELDIVKAMQELSERGNEIDRLSEKYSESSNGTKSIQEEIEELRGNIVS